jgi:hypothetical protein
MRSIVTGELLLIDLSHLADLAVPIRFNCCVPHKTTL